MTESYESDAILNALSGTTDTLTGAIYPTIAESPYYTSWYKEARQAIKNIGPTLSELQPFVDDGATHRIGVRSGKLLKTNGAITAYAGGTLDLTNGSTNSVYLFNASGTWTIAASVTGFVTGEIMKIASVDLSGSPTDLLQSHITDVRGDLLWNATGTSVPSMLTWENDLIFYENEPVIF